MRSASPNKRIHPVYLKGFADFHEPTALIIGASIIMAAIGPILTILDKLIESQVDGLRNFFYDARLGYIFLARGLR